MPRYRIGEAAARRRTLERVQRERSGAKRRARCNRSAVCPTRRVSFDKVARLGSGAASVPRALGGGWKERLCLYLYCIPSKLEPKEAALRAR